MFWKRRKAFSYVCSCCGEAYSGSPSFSIVEPPFVHDLQPEHREQRAHFDGDICWIKADEADEASEDIFAIRVMLEIGIRRSNDLFFWGVWVTQSKDSILRYLDGVGTDQRGEMSFGWLPVTMPPYKRTAEGAPFEYLACDVLWQDAGLRPKIVLHECDHPLYLDQRRDISWDRAAEIAQMQMARLHKRH